jgi:hypothetical protein
MADILGIPSLSFKTLLSYSRLLPFGDYPPDFFSSFMLLGESTCSLFSLSFIVVTLSESEFFDRPFEYPEYCRTLIIKRLSLESLISLLYYHF